MNTIDSVIASLTFAQAKEYAATADKYVWVVVNVLDPIDMRVTDSRVSRIEDRLEEILESVK
jgi:hypothetical protein